MESLDVIKTITEAGATGVSVLLIYYLIKKLASDMGREKEWVDLMRDFNKSINNHMIHTEASNEKNMEVMIGLTNTIERVGETIRGCPGNKLNK